MIPKIGLLVGIDKDKTVSMLEAYGRVIEKTGGLPLILSYIEDEKIIDEFVRVCDGFLFTGGADIEPDLYGESKKNTCGATQPHRDKLEIAVFNKAYRDNKPILAICRGMQLVNVALGGTLYQDIPTEYKTDILHTQVEERFLPSHQILIERNSPLYSLTKKDIMVGNSFHHQAIKDLGKRLNIMARAYDGTVEAVWAPDRKYLCGYQWHPERLFQTDSDNRKIFEEFILESSRTDK